MNKHLFGNEIKKELICNVYHDEREIHGKWLYHGFLFIPSEKEKEFLEDLNKAREESKWEKELHFVDLKDTCTMNDLAIRWINLFCSKYRKLSYFYFFGVDYNKLAKDMWQNKKTRDFKIYNRFFQIGLYGAIKWFFVNQTSDFQKVVIENIYSDAKSRMPNDKFHSQPIAEVEFKSLIKDEPITFQCSEIIEVESNHDEEIRYKEASHVIQFVDLVIGGVSQVLDNTSKHEGKCGVAKILIRVGLPKEIMGYSQIHFDSVYYKKYAVSFFPKEKLSKDQIVNKSIFAQKNQFYNERTLAFCNKNQINLFGD
jgi:hypothetical protein